MIKIIRLLLLFGILTLALIFILLQTPAGKTRIKGWIEEKTEGALSIGKIEGLLPFWIRLHDVRYQTESVRAQAGQLDLFLSPGTFFFGELSFIKMYSAHAHVQIEDGGTSPSLNWPASPLPITVHSMKIDSLDINQFKKISLSGAGAISEDFSLRLDIAYDEYAFRLGIEGDAETKTVGVAAHIQEDTSLDLWLSGIYHWKSETFSGKVYGNAYDWELKSDLSLNDGFLTLTDAFIKKEDEEAKGALSFNLETRFFQSEGRFLDRPYSAKGKIAWEKGEAHLSDFSLRYSGNTLYGNLIYCLKDGTFTGESDLQLSDLSHYLIEGNGHGHLSIKPEETTFTLSGSRFKWKDFTFSEMKLNGKIKEGRLTFSLALRDFVVLDPAYEVFPTSHLNLTGEADGEKLSLKGEVWGLGSQPFVLSAEIPIELSLNPFDINIIRNTPFSIKLKGRGSIDPILAFLENASLIARGDIDVDLALTGTWDHPVVEGMLVYDNGHVESLATGAVYRGIRMEMVGEGRALKIRSMSARDLGRGDLSGTGQIAWNPEKGFPFEFVVNAKQFTLLAVDPLSASADAQLSISGNIHEMSIKGIAAIVDAHLAIPNKMPAQVPTLEVTYINPLPTPKPEIPEEKKAIPIYWDLNIEIPRRFIIDGRGLVSEWRGWLHMNGPQDALKYAGKLKLIQGRFSLVGRTFDLVDGKIQIEGLDPKDITVDLKGDLELASITASINLCGSLDSTHVAFTSNPPMSTNQILSWILFNQDVNELTPFQACRLANVLVQLSGKYAGPSVFNNIKEGLGIDVFDITNCDIDSADLTFQVGKYISQGTFVGVSKSLSGDFDSVLIQTRLYRDFYLEGDYGGSLNGLTPNGGKLIFKWYKTY